MSIPSKKLIIKQLCIVLVLLISDTLFSQHTYQPGSCIYNSLELLGSHEKAYYSKSRYLLRSNSKFEIWGEHSEEDAADTLIKVLTANYNRLADSLNVQLTEIVVVDVYPDLTSFHAGIGYPSAPVWLVGTARGVAKIDLVTPYNAGPYHNFTSMIQIVTHELAHCLIRKLAGTQHLPIWLNEGTASYLAYQVYMPNQVCDFIGPDGVIPTLPELNNHTNFATIGGYNFSYTIAEFIVHDFGNSDALSEFIKSAADYSVLGFADMAAFQDGWHRYFNNNLPCGNGDPVDSSRNALHFFTEKLFEIYPNPCDDKLYVSAPSPVDLSIYNLDRKKLIGINDFQGGHINVSALEKGIYLLVFKSQKQSFSRKLIVD